MVGYPSGAYSLTITERSLNDIDILPRIVSSGLLRGDP